MTAFSALRPCPHCGADNRVPARHLSHHGRCGACREALPPLDAPLEVDAQGFSDVISAAQVPVLVDFWAPWCGPCKMVAPHVAHTAKASAGKAVVLKVNSDQNPSLMEQFGIRGIPTFMVFKGGRKVVQESGAVDQRQLQAWLQQAGA